MSNNQIIIKRSSTVATPTALAFGEMAFGANGDLYIGDAASSPVKVGGTNYVTQADLTAAANTAETNAKTYADQGDADLQAQVDAEVTARTNADAQTLADAKGYTDAEIDKLVGTSPQALDTLNELAAALGNDENFAATVNANITANATEIARVEGKLDAHVANVFTPVKNAVDALGSMANQDASAVAITGGTADSVTLSNSIIDGGEF